MQIFGRGVHVVWPDDKLGDVLAELKQGRSHLALVRDVNNENDSQDPYYEVKGIITLEGKSLFPCLVTRREHGMLNSNVIVAYRYN